ncbi:SPFH domain-containing protein [Knoellia subterranea]|uniref:Band 7 domain-containing protein n=1 Tax=Knoellia subterranea KCTC 19937 TaxID=1385521 RepID=A0A0A0JGZ3_9MICO|nr:SPFH domain-containing protein [Knoellia subterranea]KGN36403.1 hypothetical protein N803_05525 [Knoellia subterranea KCTC 19937]
METGLVSWLPVPVAALVVGAVASVRIIGEQQRGVVTRLGRTHRVVGPGVSLHLPLVERVATVSLRPEHVVLSVPAVTCDGATVHIVGMATVVITDPEQATTAAPDPASAAVVALEDGVARAVARLALAEVLPARERLESDVLEEVNDTMAARGTRVATLDLRDFETRLTAGLLASARLPGDDRPMGSRTER